MTLGDFEQFCARNQNGMYNVAMKVLHNPQFAEDAVQDAFVRIFSVAPRLSFKNERAETVYALRAVNSAAIDILRRQRPLIDIEEIQEATVDTACDAVLEEEAVQEITEMLGPKALAVFSYRLMGLADTEIAGSLGISIESVRSIAYRARKRLARSLDQRKEGDEDGRARADY